MDNDIDKPQSSPVWDFNCHPERYVHHSWLMTLPNAELLEKLKDNTRVSNKLSRYLMYQFGFNDKFFFNFSDPITRIALLPGSSLEELIQYVGVSFHHKSIQQVIQREDVLSLREILGDELYSFSIKQSPSLLNDALKTLPLPNIQPFEQRSLLTGLICLHAALQNHPVALRKRLILKLPREWFKLIAQHSQHYPEWLKQQQKCAQLFTHIASLIINENELKGEQDVETH